MAGADGKPKTMVLRDVNVAIERGKTVGIGGWMWQIHLARVFAGLLPPSDGGAGRSAGA